MGFVDVLLFLFFLQFFIVQFFSILTNKDPLKVYQRTRVFYSYIIKYWVGEKKNTNKSKKIQLVLFTALLQYINGQAFRYINWPQKCIRYSTKVLREVKVTVQQYDTGISATSLSPFVQTATFKTTFCKMHRRFQEFMSGEVQHLGFISACKEYMSTACHILWLRYRCVISCTKHNIKNRAWIRWKVLSEQQWETFRSSHRNTLADCNGLFQTLPYIWLSKHAFFGNNKKLKLIRINNVTCKFIYWWNRKKN